MNLRRSRLALHGIERDLVHSDPRLNTLFESFTGQAGGGRMPGTEKIETRSLRLFGRLGRRADRHQLGEDWRARAPGES
jgi:hypothetical protein